MLTTKDNPFDPFEEFEKWLQMDIAKGYYCCNLVAERAIVSDGDASKEEDAEAIGEAIDEIIKEFPMFPFVKVSKEY
jgi:hypothetical protein